MIAVQRTNQRKPQIATATETAATSAYATASVPGVSGSPNSLPATATPAEPLTHTVRATETRHVSSPMKLPMNRPRTPKVAPEDVALFVAVREPMRISGTSRICPTMVPTAIAEIVAHSPSPNDMPSQPKAMAPSPTEPPTKTTKNVPGVDVRSPSGMRSTPLRSKPDGPMPCGRATTSPGAPCGSTPMPASSRISAPTIE